MLMGATTTRPATPTTKTITNKHGDSVRYFSPSIPGSGIFLPAHRATKIDSPDNSALPQTPTTSGARTGTGPSSRTPPTPSAQPKFSQSVGPGARHPFSSSVGPGTRTTATTPQAKAKPRSSIAHTESPFAKPPPLPPTPSGRTSNVGFHQSLRSASRPVALPSPVPVRAGLAKPRTPAPAVRPPSRSSSRAGSRLQELSADDDDETSSVPTPRARPSLAASRTPSRSTAAAGPANAETRRLQQELESRDQQLREQAASLAAMEVSFGELQASLSASHVRPSTVSRAASADADVISALEAQLADKNGKLATLTADFDAHRADFRSTIDTLELASSETERVYERRVDELSAQLAAQAERGEELASVAIQLKQLEELVAELEDGLEDARRGEADARAETAFLREELERARTDAAAAAGRRGADGGREVEKRDDEIRGLKAIIHSLGAEAEARQADRASDDDAATELARLSDEVEELRRDKARLDEEADELRRDKAELQELVDERAREDEDEDEDEADDGHADQHEQEEQHLEASAHAPAPTHSAASTAATSARTPAHSAPPPAAADVEPVYDAAGTGPAPGKASRRIDMTRWCALCERDGHESVDCPFEEEY